MANSLTNLPISIDTDITTWRGATAVKNTGVTTGLRITKMMLVVLAGGAATAGQVTITAPSDSATLYPPIIVGTQAAYTVILNENFETTAPITWRDFAVTGVTATGTRLYLWYQSC